MAKAKTSNAAANGLSVVTVVSAPPSKFRLVPAFQGRVTPVSDDDALVLAESMSRDGQQQPIQARAVSGTDEYEIIFGNTRKRAADMIVSGWKDTDGKEILKANPDFKLRAEIVEVDDKTAFARNVIENAHRNKCTEIDNAKNQQKLRDEHGMSDAAIARLYGYAQPNVTRLKKILELPEDIQNAIHMGTCSARAGYMLATAQDVVKAGAFDAVWSKVKDDGDAEDGARIGEAQMGQAIKAWRTEQKQPVPAADGAEGTQDTPSVNPDGTPVEGNTGNGNNVTGTVTPNTKIGLTYKQFKDVFRDAIESPRIPPKCKDLCQMILSYAEGETEDSDFVNFLLFTTGEEMLPEPEPTPAVSAEDSFPLHSEEANGEQPAEATEHGESVESPVPQQEKPRKVTRK